GLGCSGDSTGSNPDPNMHTRIAWCKMKEVVTMAARPRRSFGAASAPATRASPVSIRKARQDYVATATEQTIDTADHSDTATSATVQVHLRLLPTDALLLRRLAGDRGQTLSG